MPVGDSRAPVSLVFNLREIERNLKAFDKDLATRTRKLMAAESRKVRDEIRADWAKGPKEGGHSFRAVTSGTRGLNPTIKLNRAYRPYVGWLVFGGRRHRRYVNRATGQVLGLRVDKRDRRMQIGSRDGLWFYPGVKRARKRVEQRVRYVLKDAVRQAGLD